MSPCVTLINEPLFLRVLPAVLLSATMLVPAQAQALPGSAPGVALPQAPEEQVRGIGQVVTGIASYVKWPVAQAGLQLCVAGETRYADTLLDGTAQARTQHIHAMRLPVNLPAAFSRCDIVYFGSLSAVDRRKLLDQLSGQPVLLISEPTSPCGEQMMFCLKIRNEQIAFEANLDAITQSGLRVHPNVLQLARRKAKP